MSGLVCGLIVLVPPALGCPLGCFIQLILAAVKHAADGDVDITD
jgi:hypothetical protein